MTAAPPSFAILASGRGSNAVRLMEAFAAGELDARLALVLSDRSRAPVLERARERGVEAVAVPRRRRPREEHEDEVLAVLARHRVDHLLLAGYMRILSPHFLDRFPGSILNIHPSLLPDFPGLDAPRQQWEAGVQLAGATVHLVDEGVDSGPVLLQGSLEVRGDEGPDGLADRILTEVEHQIYPQALRLFIHELGAADAPPAPEGGPAPGPPAAQEAPVKTGTVRRALLSVSDKTGLVEFARGLVDREVELVASGGTAAALREAGLPVIAVAEQTGAPEVLGGRVKTLHPAVHAGILADRRQPEHLEELEAQGYGRIDLVACNLYPFERRLAADAEHATLVESIDIGGPAMIRAAAKNADGGVTVLTDPEDYAGVLEQVADEGEVPLASRRRLAAKAFARTAAYDAAVATWSARAAAELAADPGESALPATLGGFTRGETLRYGENPHQSAALYRDGGELGVAHGTLLAGKPLSYNNFLDLDGAYRAAALLEGGGCAVVKHTNPCGLAEDEDQAEAFRRALAGDPVAAFGSILGFNRPLEGATAAAIKESKLFVECIAAPAFTEEALDAFRKRKNLRLFQVPPGDPRPRLHSHRIGGGLLVQESDPGPDRPDSWRVVTEEGADDELRAQLGFAMKAVSTLKSNAVCVTKGRRLLGAGAGMMSRVDACEVALKKAGDETRDAVLASDAFFPFDDCVRMAASMGIRAVVQPGGSKRDQEVIDACDELGLVMVFTGTRHFRH